MMDVNSGYIGHSMSRRAAEAYEDGEMPKSKWTKKAMVAAIQSYCDEFDMLFDPDVLKGMRKDEVFERFFRLDKSRSKETGGTGLGLAIVKHAVQYHHGTICVEGAQGEGTTFVLRLPAA